MLNMIIAIIYWAILVPGTITLAIFTGYFSYKFVESFYCTDCEENDDLVDPFMTIGCENSQPELNSDKTSPIGKDRVVVSREIDHTVHRCIDHLFEYYLISWFEPLVVPSSTGTQINDTLHHLAYDSVQHLRDVLKSDLWTLVSCFIDRLYTVNHVNFIASSLVNRVVKHYQKLNQSRRVLLDSQITQENGGTLGQPLSSLWSNSQQLLKFSRNYQSNSLTAVDLECHLSSLLSSQEAEKRVQLQLANFLLDTLLRDASDRLHSPVARSSTIRQLLIELLASGLHYAIEQLSSPSFLNCQIVLLGQKYMPIKDLIDPRASDLHEDEWNQTEETATDSEWGGELHLVAEMRHCVIYHRLDRLYELLDQCEEIDSLRSVRLHLVAEILDVAVVSYLKKYESLPGGELHCDASSDLDDVRTHTSSTSSHTSYKKSFHFNAKIDSKFKRLKRKNLQRLIAQLRYAKTVCEQKIEAYKRNLALPITPLPHTASFETCSSDSTLNAEIVQPLDNKTIDPAPKPVTKEKRILRFAVVMSSEVARQCFARFLATWLVGGEQRSTWHQWQHDTHLADCSIYLFEVWQALQTAFHYLTHHCEHHRGQPQQIKALLESFSSAYRHLVTTFSDTRFNFVFSQRFLQLPSEMLHQLESFLLGDVELNALEPDCASLRYLSKIPEASLEGLHMHRYMRVLLRLERVIYDCLHEEFYPQFLISADYDQMMSKYTIDLIESTVKPLPTTLWNQLTPPDECSLEDQLLSHKPLSQVWLNRDQHVIDLIKNRQLLLHSLEFALFGLLCVKTACRKRLALKMALHSILNGMNRNQTPLGNELLTQLSIDLAELRSVLDQLDRVLSIGHCWLNADFTCHVSEVMILPSVSDVPDMDLTFCVNTTALPTGLQNSTSAVGCHLTDRLVSHWAFQWNSYQSLSGLIKYHNVSATPLLRMLSFLTRHHLGDYFNSLFPLLDRQSTGPLNVQESRVIDKLYGNLNKNIHEIKQKVRAEQRKQEQNKMKTQTKVEKTESRLSFKRLLDRERREDSGDVLISGDEELINDNVSSHIQQAQQCLEHIFSQLTANSSLTRSVGFVHLVQYEVQQSESFSTRQCLRCQLTHQLFKRTFDHRLSDWIQLSLASTLARFAPNVHLHHLIRAETGPKNMPGIHARNLASSLSARLWNSSVRSLEGEHQSQQLLFLHARSILTECHNAPELLDLLLAACGHFANHLCNQCRHHLDHSPRKIYTAYLGCTLPRTLHRYRLFKVNQVEQSASRIHSAQLATNVITTLSETNSRASRGCPHEADHINFNNLFSASHEDDDANLIEPLFQLITEIFELKGTVIRTLRRTLMFAVGIFFGQTILSRPIKGFLHSLVTESNTLHWLQQLDRFLERQAKSAAMANECNQELNNDPSQIEHYLDNLSHIWDSLREVELEDKTKEEKSLYDGALEAIELDSMSSHENECETVRERRLQVLAKQLMLASAPSFLHHLFGQRTTTTGLNKCFDSLQYQQLNKQLLYEFIEAFLLEYFPEFKQF